MSTRGMIGIRVGSKEIGVYNHFDSYPEGLGVEIADFIKNNLLDPTQKETFCTKAGELIPVDSDKKPSKQDFRYYSTLGESSLDSERSRIEWYALLRNFQYDNFLPGVMSGVLKHYEPMWDFQEDLFCEYAYILNMYLNRLECYASGDKVAEIPFQKVSKESLLKAYGKKVTPAPRTEPDMHKSAYLSMKNDKSDKLYSIFMLLEPDDTYTVTAEYGRRGAKEQRVTKGVKLSKDDAEALFAKIKKEKMAKGYKVDF